MTGGPAQLEIGALQQLGVAVQSAFGTAATTGFTYVEWRTRAIKPVTGRKLYKTGKGVRGNSSKRGRSRSNTGGTFSLALQNIQGVPLIAYAFGCDDVTSTVLANASTLNGAVTAGDSSVVVTSATGFTTATGFIQIGPDANGRSEVHAVGTVSGTTINLLSPETLSRSYATATATHTSTGVTNLHTFSNALSVPYLTLRLNRSGQWFQVQDVQFDKLALALSGDDEWMLTYTLLGGNGFTELATPSAPTFTTDINELNLADLTAATLLNSVPVTDVEKLTLNLSNNIKQGWTGGSYYPQKQKEGEFDIAGDVDLFFDAAAVETMVQSMVTGTEVDAAFTIGNHILTLKNCNFLEPDWADSLADLNRIKDSWECRDPNSSTWSVSSTTIYLPWV